MPCEQGPSGSKSPAGSGSKRTWKIAKPKMRAGLLSMAGLLAATLSLPPAEPAFSASDVNVLYAGSLVNLMEHDVRLAFDKSTGNQFRGYAGGSVALANQIKGKLRRGESSRRGISQRCRGWQEPVPTAAEPRIDRQDCARRERQRHGHCGTCRFGDYPR